MQTRQLGNTDLHLTTIGLGTWAIGGGDWAYGWGPQNDAESIAAILEMLASRRSKSISRAGVSSCWKCMGIKNFGVL